MQIMSKITKSEIRTRPLWTDVEREWRRDFSYLAPTQWDLLAFFLPGWNTRSSLMREQLCPLGSGHANPRGHYKVKEKNAHARNGTYYIKSHIFNSSGIKQY